MKSNRKREIHMKLQIQLILSQLAALRRELRETLHAYEARLEISLAETIDYVAGLKTAKRLRRERIDHIDKLIVLLRSRKLKPEKGRRKDLRRVEEMITQIRATLPGS
jgi:hypothetical protein